MSRRLARYCADLADLARDARAPWWSAHLVSVADGDERERALAFDALAVLRWSA